MTRTPRRRRLRAGAAAAVAAAAVLGLSACGAVVGVGPAPTGTVAAAVDTSRAQEIATRVVAQARQAAATPGKAGTRCAPRPSPVTPCSPPGPTRSSPVPSRRRRPRAASWSTRRRRARGVPRGVVPPHDPRAVALRAVRPAGPAAPHDPGRPHAVPRRRERRDAPRHPGARLRPRRERVAGAEQRGPRRRRPLRHARRGYADSLAYPAPKSTTAKGVEPDDGFAAAVRDNAAAQAKAVAALGSFRQVHDLRSVVGGLDTANDRGVLVFATMDRADTILVRSGTLSLPKSFTTLSGLSSCRPRPT